MQGVLGLALMIIGAVLIYDVVAGKSQTLVNLVTGNTPGGFSSTNGWQINNVPSTNLNNTSPGPTGGGGGTGSLTQ